LRTKQIALKERKIARLGVKFTNILCAAFSYESFAQSFFVLTFRFELLLAKEY
jgi:hypothetical protein